MPIYGYQCQECGAISEKLLVGGVSGADIRCSHCGSQRVSRILSVASLLTKKVTSSVGHTRCGQEERCDTPPCSSGGELPPGLSPASRQEDSDAKTRC